MENTGLSDILKAPFRGDEKMLLSKNFSNNIRALRMAVEEIKRLVFLDCVLPTFVDLMSYFEDLAYKIRTGKLWLDALVWPIFIAFRFIRSSHEDDWLLYIHTAKAM